MVKKLDENPDFLLDHVGWRLWRANRAWQAEFAAAMRAAGHGWFTEARASLLGHLSRAGSRQAMLIERMGISKQAIQQLLDGLEAEGIVERAADPRDARGKLVRYTAKGLAALQDGDAIKFQIEQGYRRRLGADGLAALMQALAAIGGDPGEGKHEQGDSSR